MIVDFKLFQDQPHFPFENQRLDETTILMCTKYLKRQCVYFKWEKSFSFSICLEKSVHFYQIKIYHKNIFLQQGNNILFCNKPIRFIYTRSSKMNKSCDEKSVF